MHIKLRRRITNTGPRGVWSVNESIYKNLPVSVEPNSRNSDVSCLDASQPVKGRLESISNGGHLGGAGGDTPPYYYDTGC